MTTTVAVKDELARARAAEPAARLAEVVTVLRFAGTVDREASAAGMRVVIEAELDSGAVARRLCGEIRGLFGIAAHESTPVGVLRRSRGCLVRVVGDGSELARRAGLTDGRGRWLRGLPPTVVGGDLGVVAAAWRGAFLARGCWETVAGRRWSCSVRARSRRWRWSAWPGGWACAPSPVRWAGRTG